MMKNTVPEEKKHSLGAAFRFLLSHTWIYYLALFLVTVTAILMSMHRAGISPFWKQTSVTVKSAYYQAAMECWNVNDYQGAEENLLNALEETQSSKSNRELETAEIMQKLGALYLDMSRYEESFECLNSAYVAFRDKLGEKDGTTLLARCQIASYDIATGNVEHGLAELSDAYDLAGSVLPKIQIAQMLAQTYTQLGDYARADGFYQILFQLYDMADPAPVLTALLWNDYGVMLASQGEDEKALAAYANAESCWQQASSTPDHNLALIYENAAQTYAVLNQPQEAISHAEKALEIRQSISGADVLPVANAYLTIANVYSVLQMPEQQLDALNSAHSIAVSAAGENSSLSASIYRAIGDHYRNRGDLDAAIENHLAAMEIQKNILGESDYGMAVICRSLCRDYADAGDYEKSIEMGLKAIGICESLFGRDNPLTAEAYLQIVVPYLDCEEYDTAISYAVLGKDIVDRHLQEPAFDLAWADLTLAVAYREAGRLEESFPLFEKALTMYEAACQTNYSEDIMNTYRQFGVARYLHGDCEDARKLFRRELAICEKIRPNDADYRADIYNYLGLSSSGMSLYDEALSYYADAEQVYQEAITSGSGRDAGSVWKKLAIIYNNMAAVYETQEKYEEAAEYELKTYQILQRISVDYRAEPKIAQRLERIYQQLQPGVPFEDWLESGAE